MAAQKTIETGVLIYFTDDHGKTMLPGILNGKKQQEGDGVGPRSYFLQTGYKLNQTHKSRRVAW